ncbi:KPN_01571 family protein [Escherichia coli]|nr:hypothetical protein BE965_24340 [Escherichia coli]
MTHSKMNPFIWVLIILMTLDALRELAGASSILGWLLTLVCAGNKSGRVFTSVRTYFFRRADDDANASRPAEQ